LRAPPRAGGSAPVDRSPPIQNQQMLGSRKEVLRAGRPRWSARGDGEPLWRGRRQDSLERHEARGLDGVDRSPDEVKHADRGSAEPAAEAMILIVHRARMVMVVRVGARLVRGMGEDPPAGLARGTLLAGSRTVLEELVKLVERWRDGQGEVEQQEQRCPRFHPTRRAGLEISNTHATRPTFDRRFRSRSHPRAARPSRKTESRNRAAGTGNYFRKLAEVKATAYHGCGAAANAGNLATPAGECFSVVRGGQ